jgi:hypothetical protein
LGVGRFPPQPNLLPREKEQEDRNSAKFLIGGFGTLTYS